MQLYPFILLGRLLIFISIEPIIYDLLRFTRSRSIHRLLFASRFFAENVFYVATQLFVMFLLIVSKD